MRQAAYPTQTQPSDRTESLSSGIRVAAGATFITIGLAVAKWAIGAVTGSEALRADALHSASDVLAIGSAWFGLHLARRPPSRAFPFGLYKAETFASFIASVFILVAGGAMLRDGLMAIPGKPEIALPGAALSVSLISSLVSYFIARRERSVGRRINAHSLLANADESRADVVTSAVVLAGIVASILGLRYIEGVVAVGVSAFVIWLGLRNIRTSIYGLLDASIEPEKERSIKDEVARVRGVLDVGDIRIRRAGPFYFGEVPIKVRKSVDVARGHDVASAVEALLRERFQEIEHVTVHVEPYRATSYKVLVPVEEAGEGYVISRHFGRSGYFAECDVDPDRQHVSASMPNRLKERDVRVGLNVIREMVEGRGVDSVIVKEIGEIAFHALRDSFVEIYKATDGTLAENLAALAEGRLALLTEPTHSSERRV